MGELRRAREKADEAAAEAARLQRKLKALESTTPTVSPGPATGVLSAVEVAATTHDEDVAEEKKRLRTKVEELQRIVSQGQEERRELRQRLAAATERSAQTASTETTEGRDDTGDDGDDGGEAVDRPRRVLVPAFSPRASKAIADLPAETAELVFVLVAELAAGRENAWTGVKRLRARQVLSARAGIHYRILFRIDDGALDVAHVTHRRDLEQAIARLE